MLSPAITRLAVSRLPFVPPGPQYRGFRFSETSRFWEKPSSILHILLIAFGINVLRLGFDRCDGPNLLIFVLLTTRFWRRIVGLSVSFVSRGT